MTITKAATKDEEITLVWSGVPDDDSADRWLAQRPEGMTLVAITKTDEEHRILEVLWERNPPGDDDTGPKSLRQFAEAIRDGKYRGAEARRIATFVIANEDESRRVHDIGAGKKGPGYEVLT